MGAWVKAGLLQRAALALCAVAALPHGMPFHGTVETALAGRTTEVTVFIKQAGAAELRAALERVSDPAGDNWGSFLTHDEVVALQRPTQEHIDLVEAQLLLLNATSITWTIARDKAVASIPPSAAAAAAAAGDGEDKSADAATALADRLREWQAELVHAVDFVAADTRVRDGIPSDRRSATSPPAPPPRPRSPPAARPEADPQGCLFDRAVPPCIRAAYGVHVAANNTAFNAQAVIVNQPFKPSDLAAFENEHGLPPQQVVKTVGTNAGTAGDEASLDVQFIVAMGQLVPTWWVYIDGHVANPFASWLTWASNTSQVAYVHSLSVGEPEGTFARDNGGSAAITRINDEMAALGARGVSLVFASGDSGYTAQQKYPASSPVVTSVGGVTFGPIYRAPWIEVDGETTGGFSSLPANAAPQYQTAAVSHFIHNTTGGRPTHNIDPTRRCVPDLSAYSTEFYIVQDGGDSVIGGTSAATPVVAGMLSLINDALITAGHGPLGFANPFLYQNADAFLDVTHGRNGVLGYEAVAGYDPASGLGTFSPTTFATLRDRALKRRGALAHPNSSRARRAVTEAAGAKAQA